MIEKIENTGPLTYKARLTGAWAGISQNTKGVGDWDRLR